MKWDAFIGRKGGMKNTLAPLKTSTHANDMSAQPASSSSDFNHQPKLDAIPPGKRNEEPQTEARMPSPIQEQEDEHEANIDERPQSPTPEQQHQRHVEDQQNVVVDEENKTKESLAGKPIIFVGGGPGRAQSSLRKLHLIVIFQGVEKVHNVKK